MTAERHSRAPPVHRPERAPHEVRRIDQPGRVPRRCPVAADFGEHAAAADHVMSVQQLEAFGWTRDAIDYRLRRRLWQLVLPQVVGLTPLPPTTRQRRVAALVWAGDRAAIDGSDACRLLGLNALPPDDLRVRVVTDGADPPRTRHFVVVRRRTRPFSTTLTQGLPVLTAADAVVAAGRQMRRQRDVTALFSEAVQRGFVALNALQQAHLEGPPRGRRLGQVALEAVAGGARSAPEAVIRELMLASPALPIPVFNRWIELPGGRRLSPDALITQSALIHEVNGRKWHARGDLFDDMQERHDALVEAGFVVLHNTPRRIDAEPHAVLRQIERTHQRYAGRGLPEGVVLLSERH